MRISELKQVLKRAIELGKPVMLTGEPGCGKSDIVIEAARECGADVILSHPVVSDPTDAKGLPWVAEDKNSATFLPFGDLHRAMTATKKTVWFLDDLGQASPAVQASYMQLLLARQVNGHAIPDCVTFAAATNRKTDRAGVTGILEPVKSRFAMILGLDVNLDDWCDWATVSGITPELIAFLRFRPGLLSDFQPSADMTQSPSPRTWKNANDVLKMGLPHAYEFEAISGAVGKGAATEFISFLSTFRALPDLEGILRDPMKSPIPKQPDALYAVSIGLAHRADATNIGSICKYAERLSKGSKGEFAVLMLRDTVRRNAELAKSKEFIKLASSDLKGLILGN